MKLVEIQDLIKFVAKSGVSEVEIETDGIKLVIKTGGAKRGTKGQVEQAPTIIQAPMPVQGIPVAVAAPAIPVAPVPAAPSTPEATKSEDDESNYVTIKSPMIGTFYRKSSPDKPSFVNVGDSIKEGSVLCIIEAMKLFNEIESEMTGKIIKVLVDNNTPVEYDQPLFLVDPR